MIAKSGILDISELVPISLLLVIGVVIAIRSGVHHVTTRQDWRQVMANLTQVVLRVLGYGAAMVVVHEWIGMRLGW